MGGCQITLVTGTIIILMAIAGSIISGALDQEYKNNKGLSLEEDKNDIAGKPD